MAQEIQLTKGYMAIVDDEDAERVSALRWRANEMRNGVYAERIVQSMGIRKCVSMHRFIAGAKRGEEVDHINHNTLDNRKINLRICSRQENCMNKPKNQGYTSIFKGVCLVSKTTHGQKRWRAQIQYNREQIFLGRYHTDVEAAHAYDASAKELFGQFANLNFPESVNA